MKISILKSLPLLLFVSAVWVGCDSPQKNVTDAKADLVDAQLKLAESQRDSVQNAEWQSFKTISQDKIAANELTIMTLKRKQYDKGTFMDPAREKKIADLEARNKTLQGRIDDYEKYHSNWESFKREFNHDMEEIGKSIKDIANNNAK